jgi:hypothetical protein
VACGILTRLTFALPIFDLGESYPVFGDARQAMDFAGVTLFAGLARHYGSHFLKSGDPEIPTPPNPDP